MDENLHYKPEPAAWHAQSDGTHVAGEGESVDLSHLPPLVGGDSIVFQWQERVAALEDGHVEGTLEEVSRTGYAKQEVTWTTATVESSAAEVIATQEDAEAEGILRILRRIFGEAEEDA